MPSRYDITHFSHHLWRNMNIRIYGGAGWPMLVFPTRIPCAITTKISE